MTPPLNLVRNPSKDDGQGRPSKGNGCSFLRRRPTQPDTTPPTETSTTRGGQTLPDLPTDRTYDGVVSVTVGMIPLSNVRWDRERLKFRLPWSLWFGTSSRVYTLLSLLSVEV